MIVIKNRGNLLHINRIELRQYPSRIFFVITLRDGDVQWAVGAWPDGSSRREIPRGTPQWEALRAEVSRILAAADGAPA
jgi:hypothetical protein